jgi:hypothetical protein
MFEKSVYHASPKQIISTVSDKKFETFVMFRACYIPHHSYPPSLMSSSLRSTQIVFPHRMVNGGTWRMVQVQQL